METVIKVEKSRRAVIVTTSEEQKYHLSYPIYKKMPLVEGDEIDTQQFEQFLLLNQYRFAVNYAVSLLAKRNHSTGEIRQKLIKCNYIEATVEMVIFKLQKEKLLDDTNFANEWVTYRKSKGYGATRIKNELKLKGVSNEIIASALDKWDNDSQLNSAVETAKKLYRKSKGIDERKLYTRMMNAMARRGFSYEIAKKAIAAAREECEDN